MPTRQYSSNLIIGSINFGTVSNITAEGENALSSPIATAKALSAWVKTDADTAAGNLAADHGWATGTYDVYWTGGARYDVDVTISTNACALDGGTGDDFPATANATVVLAKQTLISGFTLDGDNAEIVAVSLTTVDPSVAKRGRIVFLDVDDDIIRDYRATSNAAASINDIAGGETNAYAGDVITYALASTEDTTNTHFANIGYMYDPTP
jgi:hypothetical protein